MITCIITYEIDPNKKALFDLYAQNWGKCIPRCGANLVGYFGPHEGSTTTAYGIYHIASLAEYEIYKQKLALDPLGHENFEFAKQEGFIRNESRLFLKRVSAPHGGGQ